MVSACHGQPGRAATIFSFGIVRGDAVEMARMAVVQDDAAAAGQARAEPGGADEDQHRNAGLDAQLVIGLIGRIARRAATASRTRR